MQVDGIRKDMIEYSREEEFRRCHAIGWHRKFPRNLICHLFWPDGISWTCPVCPLAKDVCRNIITISRAAQQKKQRIRHIYCKRLFV